jgi:uncharacterized protein YecE (DUF72 family)
MATLYAGTSGFAYPAWKPGFYPEKLPAKKFLQHYASRLNAVEANYTFRRLPSAKVLESWVAETPAHFRFALKAHQRITHFDRLVVNEFTKVFFDAIDPLRVTGRLGPVLIQLPPNMASDPAKLAAFLAAAPGDIPLAFEFRNKSWFQEEVYDLLTRHRAALCLAESEKIVVPERLTAPFVYFRLRKEDYTDGERLEIRGKVHALVAEGRDVYAFFKHEESPAGALYAEELLK